MSDAFRTVDVTRVQAGRREAGQDAAAVEEPLEVRVHGVPFAVIMRTPGLDRELAAGFLYAERVLVHAEDLGTIEHCTLPGAEHPENVINVTLAGGVTEALEMQLASRRQVAMNASCGLCGRRTIESLRVEAPHLGGACRVAAATLVAMPAVLRGVQAGFEQTGGLHAAGLFTADGTLESMAEDVGRHNAVDKVIGRHVMREALPLADRVLMVSGRASYEIVQKAFLAGIPIVAAVSAPSTLAIELAVETGMTLVGFVRDHRFNVYAHSERIPDAAS